jgi:soluble lytic murein transglycosylase
LRRLAQADVADIYGLWSREQLGLDQPVAWDFSPPVTEAPVPRTVALLIDWGERREALREWNRIRRTSSISRGEAVAAARISNERGLYNQSVRWLRAAYPGLASTGIARSPVNVVKAYLPLRWPEELVSAAREAGLEPWLVAGVARQESLFTAHAVSPRGARGVLQLIPATAESHARRLGFNELDLEDPSQNLRIGARELARLMNRFDAVEPALAAYNAGETRARRWWRTWPDRGLFTEQIPIPETYNYVRRVRFLSEAYRLAWKDVWEERDG